MYVLLFLVLTISSAHAGGLEAYISKKNPKLDHKTVCELASELKKYPKAITYIAYKESTFNPKAQSKGSVGLMGINTHVWFSSNPNYNLIKLGIIKHRKDLFKIKGNLKAGFYIWKKCKRNYHRYRGC